MHIQLAIVVPDGFVSGLWIILFLALLGLFIFLFQAFLKPILDRTRPSEMYPPKEGDRFLVSVHEDVRQARFTIGQTYGNLITLCTSITNDHLIFQFKKARDSEDYDIAIMRNGLVLFKPPRMPHFAKMDMHETLESHEIIGKTAEFRLSDKILKDRMTTYFEISLGSEFYFTKTGKERLRFVVTVSKIYPGLSERNKTKQGLYPFGKGISGGDDTAEDMQEIA